VNASEPVRQALGLPQASQVCIAVADLARAVRFFEHVLGLGPFVRPEIAYHDVTYHGRPASGRWEMAFASLGPVELELAHPLQAPNIYQDFLDAHGEGLHHIGFDVSDLDAAVARAQALGLTVLMSGRTAQGGFAHLDTRAAGGTILEVIERPARRV